VYVGADELFSTWRLELGQRFFAFVGDGRGAVLS